MSDVGFALRLGHNLEVDLPRPPSETADYQAGRDDIKTDRLESRRKTFLDSSAAEMQRYVIEDPLPPLKTHSTRSATELRAFE